MFPAAKKLLKDNKSLILGNLEDQLQRILGLDRTIGDVAKLTSFRNEVHEAADQRWQKYYLEQLQARG